jgi:predicted O-methyltransferase YrrM
MQIDSKSLQYCWQHSSSVDSVLQNLERETHLYTLHPQMLCGPYLGLLLQFISRMVKPRRILEIGTFTGYSAICLAQGLREDGLLYTIEANDEFRPIIYRHIQKAGLEKKTALLFGDAAEVLPELDESFDLIFLDAGKLDYEKHYALALPKLRPGGFLLADNVLWAGKVVQNDKDATAQALQRFNDMVQADEQVENLMLPLRDGLMLIRKR